MRHRGWARIALTLGVVGAATLAHGTPSGAAAGGELVGTFTIAPARCDGAVSGSYFRMILPSGDANGPYVANGDSSCSDDTYTPLVPGTDGGLITGGYQPAPTPAFDAGGNGVAKRITQPTPFFGVLFATSTEQVDPQTGARAAAPSVTVDGSGKLTGALSSFGASWNGQSFNQGSPKPDGTYPGNTAKITGTYDAGTGAFELTWRSQIQGGPFDDFTGVWHLAGTFRPSGSGATDPGPGGAASSGAPGAPAASASGQQATAPSGPAGDGAAPEAPVGDAVAAGDDEAAALAEGAVSTSVTTTDDGIRPASWLVVLLGAAGIVGVLWLVWMTRTPPVSEP